MVTGRISPFLLVVPCCFPAGWRLFTQSQTELTGLCSDLGIGLVIFAICWFGPRWLRSILLVGWAFFQAISIELLAAVGRLPSWRDVQYLFDPSFLKNSAAGFHLAEPLFVFMLCTSTVLAIFLPLHQPRRRSVSGLIITGLLLLLYASFATAGANQSITARYNPLHWLVVDAFFQHRVSPDNDLKNENLPGSLRIADLDGESFLEGPQAKNVLIVVLEGISGIYHPEIRQEMGVQDGPFQMEALAEATRGAMLIPDFVVHSHQTIRGLYAIHCGDLSKLSYDTPKGFELQVNAQRSNECLPAQMVENGWDTHFLQGASLQFMNKDKVMPAMGFQQVHGLEWFGERTENEFIWGVTDKDFFIGARKYVRNLQQQNRPWLLSLLTVATHQPFDAPEEVVKKYGSRKIASVARLDEALGAFIRGLHEDGVLDETLVIITSDESHGHEGADWYASWGIAGILAPEQQKLPHLKTGTFGLMDMEVSILDYLGLPIPSSVIGRSFFRDYASTRDMVSYTAGKLRWQTADNVLFECSADGRCYRSEDAKILKPKRESSIIYDGENTARLFGLATLVDHKLTLGTVSQKLQFGHGEIRTLPEKIRNEWTDNLVGAQYLAFPENSKVDVDIRLKAIRAGKEGMQLKLVLRQFEKEVGEIEFPPFPVLITGQECRVQFTFRNPEARKAFSFHLVGEGVNSSIQLQKFEVAINLDG